MKIQNSLDGVASSFCGAGIFLDLNTKNIVGSIKQIAKNKINWDSKPISVKACTEVLPKTPLLVKKVE